MIELEAFAKVVFLNAAVHQFTIALKVVERKFLSRGLFVSHAISIYLTFGHVIELEVEMISLSIVIVYCLLMNVLSLCNGALSSKLHLRY